MLSLMAIRRFFISNFSFQVWNASTRLTIVIFCKLILTDAIMMTREKEKEIKVITRIRIWNMIKLDVFLPWFFCCFAETMECFRAYLCLMSYCRHIIFISPFSCVTNSQCLSIICFCKFERHIAIIRPTTIMAPSISRSRLMANFRRASRWFGLH